MSALTYTVESFSGFTRTPAASRLHAVAVASRIADATALPAIILTGPPSRGERWAIVHPQAAGWPRLITHPHALTEVPRHAHP